MAGLNFERFGGAIEEAGRAAAGEAGQAVEAPTAERAALPAFLPEDGRGGYELPEGYERVELPVSGT